jgi:hypothetical protein
MPRYIALIPLACLTKQAVKGILANIETQPAPDTPNVKHVRSLADLTENMLVLELEAASKEEVNKWLAHFNLRPSSLLRIELESQQGVSKDVF